MSTSTMIVRALHMRQGGHDLYLFAVPGDRLLDIAEISRIGRDAAGMLEGYQRGEIRSHVADIARYLSDGDVLFPNPILLALSPDVRFKSARGSRPPGMLQTGDVGTLRLPTGANKPGW
ncbi:MAG TPA: DGQHR domain-containing protein, partial [Rhizobiaceae bacterium]|nr:DGQHR domain-containing protein [Rhizobiaceae bacterium]